MDNERIEKMAGNVVADVVGDDSLRPSLSHVRTAAVGDDEDVALANVDQALDGMIAAVAVIDDNLPEIKTQSVPEKAAVDAIKDLMATAIRPYLADILKVMSVFGK